MFICLGFIPISKAYLTRIQSKAQQNKVDALKHLVRVMLEARCV